MDIRTKVLLAAGLVFVACAGAWTAVANKPVQATQVKQTSIPLPADAFNGDPRLQNAVQNLLQNTQPQQANQPVGPAPTNSVDVLQQTGGL